MPTGFIQFFVKTKGYGYVRDPQTREEFFFKDATGDWLKGDEVTFLIKENKHGMIAIEVKKLEILEEE